MIVDFKLLSKRIIVHTPLSTALLLVAMSFSGTAAAQQRTGDFRSEIGVWAGAGGATSSEIFGTLRPAYGAMWRYKFDYRWALKAEGGIINLFSKTDNPLNNSKKQGFTNPIFDLDLTGEFNFFDFNDDPFDRSAHTITPYIFAGLGIISYPFLDESGSETRDFQAIIPFGLGFKFKLAPRLNLNIQYTHRLSFTDRLEGLYPLSDIYAVKGSNFVNKDMLSVFSVGITFDFWVKTSKCYCD